RGKISFSKRITLRPSRASMPATELPAGPPPITMTSKVFVFMRSVLFSVQVQKNRSGNDRLPKGRGESKRSFHFDVGANSFLPGLRKPGEIRSKHQRQTFYESNRFRWRRSLTAKPSRESISASGSARRPAKAGGGPR